MMDKVHEINYSKCNTLPPSESHKLEVQLS